LKSLKPQLFLVKVFVAGTQSIYTNPSQVMRELSSNGQVKRLIATQIPSGHDVSRGD